MVKKHTKTGHKPSRPPVRSMDRVTLYAVNGLYFGMGAVGLVADGAESFIKKAVERGQKVDVFEGLGKVYGLQEKISGKLSETWSEIPKQPMKIIRSLLPSRREADPIVVLEARLREDVMKAAERIQTPLKKNLQDLAKKVNNLSNMVGKIAAR